MFKFPGGLGDMLKQAQQMQETVGEIKAELEQKRLEGTAGGGMVSVIVTGACELVEVKLDPRLLEEGADKEMIENLVRDATNDGLKKAKEILKQEIGKLTGGFPIPGLS